MRFKMDFRMVRNANLALPGMISKVSGVKRGTGLLKWRIPQEIQEKYEIEERMVRVNEDLTEIIEMMNRLYAQVNSSLEQYMNIEEKNNINASKFQ